MDDVLTLVTFLDADGEEHEALARATAADIRAVVERNGGTVLRLLESPEP